MFTVDDTVTSVSAGPALDDPARHAHVGAALAAHVLAGRGDLRHAFPFIQPLEAHRALVTGRDRPHLDGDRAGVGPLVDLARDRGAGQATGHPGRIGEKRPHVPAGQR